MRIDAHHHFWQFNTDEYGWMGDEMDAIRRDFLPPDLEREIGEAGVDGAVSVQARQKLEETDWLLSMAEKHDFLRGVVGWVPLVESSVVGVLEKLASRPKLRAVRHVLHDEPDDDYMLRDDFNRGIASLHHFGLVYDVLIFEKHLPQTIEFVDRHPNQVFVVDHIAKPKIKDAVVSPWRERIVELGKRENVFCKISGMVTEADWKGWAEDELQPYMETVLEAFGPRRLMFGSDWPVCLVACPYKRWFEIVSRFTSRLSADEQAAILGETAVAAYSLD